MSENQKPPARLAAKRGQQLTGQTRSSHPQVTTSQPGSQAPIAGDGRVYTANGHVGAILYGTVARKTVRRSKHLLHTPEGWAFDQTVIDECERRGARSFVVFDEETGTTYTASMAVMRSKGSVKDRGYGPQVVLALVYWRTERPGAPVQRPLF